MSQKQKGQQSDIEEHKPFQAVLFADTYNDTFRPISNEMPLCLVPFCNVPLIEYTLENMAIANVDTVLIVCSLFKDKIQAYLERSKWLNPRNKLKVQIVHAPKARSMGDLLRELDTRHLILGDFILTSCYLVSNMKLDTVLKIHRERQKLDKNLAMTMILKEASQDHPARPKDHSGLYVIDSSTEQCLHYQPMVGLPKKKTIEFPQELLEKRTSVELRNDLIDPFVYICSLHVPSLLSENFDWQTPSDIVSGVLTDEIIDKTIYTHIVMEPYIGCIRNEQLYSTMSIHVLNRWAFPIVPETNLWEEETYEFYRGNIYRAPSVKLSRTCTLGGSVQIGSETTIGENTQISNSVIGKRCRIGNNVTLDGVFVWDDVTIDDKCVIRNSILAHKVHIMEHTSIERGCLLSIGVTAGPDTVMPKYTRASLLPQPTDDFSDDEEEDGDEKTSVHQVSNNVQYFTWSDGDESDYGEGDARNAKLGELAYDLNDLTLEDDDIQSDASIVGEEPDDDSDDDSFGEPGMTGGADDKKLAEFKKELHLTVERSLREGHSVDDAYLEINSLRMSTHREYPEIRQVVVPTVIEHILGSANRSAAYAKWGPLLSKVIHAEEDELHVLELIEKYIDTASQQQQADKGELRKRYIESMTMLYDHGVFDVDSILMWYRSKPKDDSTIPNVRSWVSPFIEWLEQDSDEEEESESDEE